MESNTKKQITVQVVVDSSLENVWECWTTPEDIIHWNTALDSWHTPEAENDLREGGRFRYRMEAKDGSMGFDFSGTYDEIWFHHQIKYTMDDGRKVEVIFSFLGDATQIEETFEPENENPVEMQQEGWQAILDNFKKYVEAL